MDSIRKVLCEQKEFFNSNKTKNIQFRINNLKKLKQIIKKNENLILKSLYLDLGKSKAEAFMAEVAMVYSEINTALKNINSWSKPKKVWPSIGNFPSFNYVYSEPYGSVLIMSPWNYPFNLSIAPLVAAIASGNCAMIKCSRTSSNVAKLIKKIIDKNFERNYIYCIDIDEKYENVLNQKYDYIFFTGSPNVGKKVMQAASENLIPFSLELGGKSPCIVDESANLKLAARRIAWGKFLNAGQTCISVDYVLVQESVKEDFIKELYKEIQINYDIDDESYPKIINKTHFDRLLKLILTEDKILGGEKNYEKNKIGPTLLIDSNFDKEVMREEIFGPILPIIEYKKLDDIIYRIKKLDKPLACYMFTNNKKAADKVINSISFGGGCINDVIVHFTNHNLPFGGVGLSGIGNYHGKYGFETFSHKKGVVKSCRYFDVPIRYKPFDIKKYHLLKKIF